MKTWKATEHNPGRGVSLLDRVCFYGDYSDAREQFVDWALDWVGADNSEYARDIYLELREKACFGGGFDSFEFDGKTYGFIRVGGGK